VIRTNRRLLLAAGLPAAAIVIAAVVILAVGGDRPPTLPIPAGTRYTLRFDQQIGVRWAGGVVFHFSLASPMNLVGGWTSDARVFTGAFSNGTPIFPVPGEQMTPGCGIAYDVTLAPGTWNFSIANVGPFVTQPMPSSTVNVTVTQTIQLVPPPGNATPVAWWAGNATATACP
jgi:hypothetical protein